MVATGTPGGPDKRADIQGLRAIAVLSVVIYHVDAALLPGGFVGVDIFFVISGFLITGILLRDLQAGRMSIAGFYYRRIRRIFPALFTMLAAVLAAGALLMSPAEYAELARTAISTTLFVSNIDFYTLSGYFDGLAADKPLLHTWSLAVEEQFYILFPLLLAFVWRYMRAWLGALLVLGTLAAFAISVWGALEHRTAAFYLTPFRAHELALGALIALYGPGIRLSQRVRDTLSLAGGALMVASFAFINPSTPFPGAASLAPCLGAGLVILAGVNGRSVLGAAISAPMFTFFGAISYSLYLWHWPALSLGRHFVGEAAPLWENVLLAVGAVGVAWLSWRFIEEPILRTPMSRQRVFGAGAAAIAATAVVAGAIYLAQGIPQRFPPRAQEMFATYEDYNRQRDRCHGPVEHNIPYADNCVYGADGVPPSVAVWGDSAGAELVVALGEALEARNASVMEITASACPPVIGYQLDDEAPHCIAHNDDTLASLIADHRMRTIVVALNPSRYPDRSAVLAALGRSVTALRSAGKAVILVYPTPNPWGNPARELGLRAAHGQPLDGAGRSYDEFLSGYADVFAHYGALTRRTGAIPFHPEQALCANGFCPLYAAGWGALYFNGNHISVSGARLALTRFPFDALHLS